MSWNICFLFLLLSACREICGAEFKQERAKVQYFNPKYIEHLHMFTFRENRQSPYLSTLNVTLAVPFGNNVTITVEFTNKKLYSVLALPVKFEMKVCDALKTKWIREWLKEYTNIPLSVCPVLSENYEFSRFQLPPKNFPFDFNNVDYAVKCTVLQNLTKEKIIELTLELKFST